MTKLIDLFFVVLFGALAIGCAVTYLVTKFDRADLFVYGVFSAILCILMLNEYNKNVKAA